MFRIGRVTQFNKETQTVQVLFDDLDQTTSNDLPVIYPHTLKFKVPRLPDINEEVVCGFLENGSDGFCIGAYATEPIKPSSIERFSFEDGTSLEYDTSTHHLTADIKGTATLKAENITLSGATTLDGNVNLKGSITLDGNLIIKGSIVSEGQATLNGGATIGGATILQNATVNGSMHLNGEVTCPYKCVCT